MTGRNNGWMECDGRSYPVCMCTCIYIYTQVKRFQTLSRLKCFKFPIHRGFIFGIRFLNYLLLLSELTFTVWVLSLSHAALLLSQTLLSLSLPPDFSLERVQDTSREEQRRRISQNPLLEIPRGARIRRIYRIYRTHFRAHTTVFALSFMGWETFVNRHSQRRLEGIEDFPLTATLNLQRCLWTFHSALPSMGAFGAAVIVKTDLPSLHHLRPLTTEPFVYSHAGGFIISVTTRRIGRRKETNYLSRDECLRWEKGKGREREREEKDVTRDFIRMIFTR